MEVKLEVKEEAWLAVLGEQGLLVVRVAESEVQGMQVELLEHQASV